MDRGGSGAASRSLVGQARNAIRRGLPTSGPWIAAELRLRRLHARVDLVRHRHLDGMARWGPVLAGAPRGHFVAPRRAIEQSRYEAARWADAGYLAPGALVLDVGSDNGRQAIGLLDVGVERYVGLEVIRECVAHCTATIDDPRCSFVHLDVRNDMYNPGGALVSDKVVFPFDDGSFDFVVAGSLYTHLEQLAAARRYAEETRGVLRPGGFAFTSWFVSPPNTVSTNPKRTVFRRADVERVLGELFEVVERTGGESGQYHDQFQVVVRRR